MRLIDKDRLLKAIDKYDKECEDILIEPSAFSIYSIIKDCPTIDQWHYPAMGELPTENERVLVYIKEHGKTPTPQIGKLKWNGEFFELSHSDYFKDEVLAWQYIIPPKEEV